MKFLSETAAVIVNPQGDVLLAVSDDGPYKGSWSLPSVRADRTYGARTAQLATWTLAGIHVQEDSWRLSAERTGTGSETTGVHFSAYMTEVSRDTYPLRLGAQWFPVGAAMAGTLCIYYHNRLLQDSLNAAWGAGV